MPADRPEIVVLLPLPVILPGLIVQLPDGRPFSITLPVAFEQVGWVIVPAIGAAGVAGCVLITMSPEADDVHPAALVTVNE